MLNGDRVRDWNQPLHLFDASRSTHMCGKGRDSREANLSCLIVRGIIGKMLPSSPVACANFAHCWRDLVCN